MKSVAIYGALLAVALGASWLKWTAAPEVQTDGKVVLMQGETDDIERIVWKDDDEEAVLERKEDSRGAYLWVTYTRWQEVAGPKSPDVAPPEPAPSEVASPDGDAPAAPAEGDATADAAPAAEEAPPPEREAKVTVFKSGEAGDKLLTSLSPLLALRKLEGVTDDKLATIGLDAPEASMSISRKGRTRTFDVGGESYGTRDRYVRDTESGEIYLLDDEVLRPLKYARTRLPDRTLFSVAREKVAEATLTGGGGTLRIAQKNADDKAKATWVRAETPDAPAEQLKTWMDKALNLKGTSYADPAEIEGELVPRFQLALKDGAGLTETLEVLQVGDDGDWYARSEHTRGLIKLLRGPTSALSDDVADIVAGVEPATPDAPVAPDAPAALGEAADG